MSRSRTVTPVMDGDHAPAADDGLLLELRSVHRTFHAGEVDVHVLKGIDMDVRTGEILTIVGPSGSGKTTVLNIIGGIDRATSGDVRFEGRDLAGLSDAQLTTYRRREIGFVFQFYNLVPTLTARENIRVASELVDGAMSAEESLTLVGLADRMDHFPSQLSGGEQQRVAIARALAKRPKLILCDEPTGALDAATGKMVLGVLTKLNDELGTTIVIVTHNAPIAQMAHRMVRMGSGRIVETTVSTRRVSAEEITW